MGFYFLKKGGIEKTMEKKALLDQLMRRFTELGIVFQMQKGTDLSIFQEFLDSRWGGGKKKISYEASVYGDRFSRTLFMWEKTKETESGFSFGFSSESHLQSGSTVFRRVKSLQYGPDGKAYEYDLDLGAIPRAVKETAQANGWNFKTVLKKEKALWPAGYSAEPVYAYGKSGEHSEDSIRTKEEKVTFCSRCGYRMRPEALFCAGCGQKK
jgi:hypothetical protein